VFMIRVVKSMHYMIFLVVAESEIRMVFTEYCNSVMNICNTFN
jgi:hypothetical protein